MTPSCRAFKTMLRLLQRFAYSFCVRFRNSGRNLPRLSRTRRFRAISNSRTVSTSPCSFPRSTTLSCSPNSRSNVRPASTSHVKPSLGSSPSSFVRSNVSLCSSSAALSACLSASSISRMLLVPTSLTPWKIKRPAINAIASLFAPSVCPLCPTVAYEGRH